MKRVCVQVTGKVQGVNYRWSTREKASELGLKGFVRNQPDGSVYLEAEGDEAQIVELVNWCRKGPSHADVKEVIVKESDLVNFKAFEIKR